MSFASISFACLFFVVLVGRCSFGSEKRGRAYFGLLLVSSLTFYSWHTPIYIFLLLGVTALNFFVAGRLSESGASRVKAKRWVSVSVIGSLSTLAYFKYSGFALRGLQDMWVWGGGGSLGWNVDVVLPIGISFYTFQALSYVIDVYRGELKHRSSFFEFLTYVSFFPQLVAGPIVRAKDFFYQWNRRRGLHWPVVSEGCFQLISGFFFKLVVADGLANIIDLYWDDRGAVYGVLGIGTLVLLFGGQIFADFAGYSMIARGLGYLLGFRLPLNFDAPYIASSLQEFWRRWHISLSTWLRDYLYIPLGGNRNGASQTMKNVFLVMVIGGLWHGAGAPFIIWGAIHGIGLIVEKRLGFASSQSLQSSVGRLGWFCVTQGVVFTAWMVFRMESFGQLMAMGRSLIFDGIGLDGFVILSLGLVYWIPIGGLHLRRLFEVRGYLKAPTAMEKAVLSGVMFTLVLSAYSQGAAFIYFEF